MSPTDEANQDSAATVKMRHSKGPAFAVCSFRPVS